MTHSTLNVRSAIRRSFVPLFCIALTACTTLPSPTAVNKENGWPSAKVAWPTTTVTTTDPATLRTMSGGFDIPGWDVAETPPGPPCETLANGDKKCFVPNLALRGPDWTTQVGLSPNNIYLIFTQVDRNRIELELYFDYHSPVREAHSPGIEYTYRLRNKNNAIVGFVKHHSWRGCGAHNEHRLNQATILNIDAVNDTFYVDMHALYRTQVTWC